MSAELKGAFYYVVCLHAMKQSRTTQQAVCCLISACRLVCDTCHLADKHCFLLERDGLVNLQTEWRSSPLNSWEPQSCYPATWTSSAVSNHHSYWFKGEHESLHISYSPESQDDRGTQDPTVEVSPQFLVFLWNPEYRIHSLWPALLKEIVPAVSWKIARLSYR